MLFTTIIALVTLTTATSASHRASHPPDCFPLNTQQLISSTQQRAINWMSDLAQHNTSLGRKAADEIWGFLSDVVQATTGDKGGKSCEEEDKPPTWPKGYDDEADAEFAMLRLQDFNKALELTRASVAKCDVVSAKKEVCTAYGVAKQVALYWGTPGQ